MSTCAPHTDGDDGFVVQLLPVQNIARVRRVQLQEAGVRADEQAAVVAAAPSRSRRRKISCCKQDGVVKVQNQRRGRSARLGGRVKERTACRSAAMADGLRRTHVLSETPRQQNTPSRGPSPTRWVCMPAAIRSWAERSSAGPGAPPQMAAGRRIPASVVQRWQASSCAV